MIHAARRSVDYQLKSMVSFMPFLLGAGLILSIAVTRDFSATVVFVLFSLALYGFARWLPRKYEEKWEQQEQELASLNSEIEAELLKLRASES